MEMPFDSVHQRHLPSPWPHDGYSNRSYQNKTYSSLIKCFSPTAFIIFSHDLSKHMSAIFSGIKAIVSFVSSSVRGAYVRNKKSRCFSRAVGISSTQVST